MPAPGPVPHVEALRNLLADAVCAPVEIARWEPLEPWAVARVRLRGADAPRSAVVKWVRAGGSPLRTSAGLLRTELAALRFLGDVAGGRLTPRVIAADPAAGLLVLEDLAPRVALDQLLRRDGAAAHGERLAAFARARGELGAVSAGHADRYYAHRTALGPVDPAADLVGPYDGLRDQALGHATALGAPPTGRARSDLAAALDELHTPGPFLALSNGDAEANNVLVHASAPADARLIDFEWAGYTHALHDAVCLYVPGPAWMSVGDPVASGLAGHYRRALADGIPQAADDRRYGHGLAAACASWALVRLHRFAQLDGRPPGDDGRAQLIATLEAAARAARTHGVLSHLTAWLHRVAGLLRRRWPDADRDFADPEVYPPYRSRQRT